MDKRDHLVEELYDRLERSWLAQLAMEFDHICAQHSLPLRPPVIQISGSKRVLGSWSPLSRTMSISRYLIAEHPWSVTLQVLKHEMAHQLCSEVHQRQRLDHGPFFQQLCRELGVDRPFRRAGADTARLLLQPAEAIPAPHQQVLEKVQKLFALGQSANEHEAALAMQKAGQLLERHNLSMNHLAEHADFQHRSIDTGRQRMAAHLKTICALLSTCFRVRVIRATLYDPLANRRNATIELLGLRENVAIAEHCYHFLLDRLQTLWERNHHNLSGERRVTRKSYYLGVLAGFREKLERRQQGATRQNGEADPRREKALMHTEAMIDHFVARRFPRLKRVRSRGMRVNPNAYQQGRAAGDRLHMHRPTDGAPVPRRLTEGSG